jgi:hypothetical protein
MTKNITNPNEWKPGQSGNPKGRPRKKHTLTEILQLSGEQVITVGDEVITAKEVLAKAVWQFVTTGEVWLSGKRLEAVNVSEWANVVKWLYSHAEPTSLREAEEEPELIVRVIREDREPLPLDSSPGNNAEEEESEPHPLAAAASPLNGEGEEEENAVDLILIEASTGGEIPYPSSSASFITLLQPDTDPAREARKAESLSNNMRSFADWLAIVNDEQEGE